MADDCAFCNYSGPSEVLWEMAGCFAIRPLNPVTDGHILVIPRTHVEDAFEQPMVTGSVFEAAAWYAKEWTRFRYATDGAPVSEGIGDCNLITSIGPDATQTVRHLHVHVVPRRAEDGLALPWSARA